MFNCILSFCLENNQNSYCENELEDNNDNSNTQGNTVPLENLFEEIPSSDAEDSVLKVYNCNFQLNNIFYFIIKYFLN